MSAGAGEHVELSPDALQELMDRPTGYGGGTAMDTAVRAFRQSRHREPHPDGSFDLNWINGYARCLLDLKRGDIPMRPCHGI